MPSNGSPRDHVQRHADGSIWAKGSVVEGLMEGYWEWFRKDGTLMRSGNFKNGKQISTWITYDKDGKPHKETEMKE